MPGEDLLPVEAIITTSKLLTALLFLAIGIHAATNTEDITIDEDDSVDVATVVYDVPAQYTRQVESAPQHGKLSGFRGNWITYSPHRHYFGTDQFVLRVQVKFDDGSEEEEISIVRVQIESINDAPLANSFTTSVARDTRTRLSPVAADPVERSPLLFRPITMPEHGQVVDSAGEPIDYAADGVVALFYQPDSGFEGRDTFELQAWDGEAYSELVTATLLVGSSLGIRRGTTAPPTEPPPTWIRVSDAAGRTRLVPAKATAAGVMPDTRLLPSGTWIYASPSDPAVLRRIVVP